jgi:hypothetical protein
LKYNHLPPKSCLNALLLLLLPVTAQSAARGGINMFGARTLLLFHDNLFASRYVAAAAAANAGRSCTFTLAAVIEDYLYVRAEGKRRRRT